MTEEKKYIYADENANIHILTEDDLPKCPKTGEISPSVWIIGNKKETPKVEHINCRCKPEITCNSPDSDYDEVKRDDLKWTEKRYSSAEVQVKITEKLDKEIATFLLMVPLAMSYEVWQYLHKVKGDLE